MKQKTQNKYLTKILMCGILIACITSCGDTDDSPTATSDKEPSTQNENTITTAYGHEYVDLGLSVNWATCNVGANRPDEYGNYYAWGETKPKSDYSWATYKFVTDDGNDLTKYTGNDKSVLDPADDAATANWGGTWRMPTYKELKELTDNCNWSWQRKSNGVEGYELTSRIKGYEGRSIFLPAAGKYTDTEAELIGTGYYATSTLFISMPTHASDIYFVNSSGIGGVLFRYVGQSVRPVLPK